MNKITPWEMSECVLINLDNLAEMTPGLDANPFFQIVKVQATDLRDMLSESSK
jgi:hypothetical protein